MKFRSDVLEAAGDRDPGGCCFNAAVAGVRALGGRLVRPEQRQDLLSRDAGSTSAGQQGKDREPARLCRGTRHHVPIRDYTDTA